MIEVMFDQNPIIWDMLDNLWGKKLGVKLQYGTQSGYCCDVLNSFNTTFGSDYVFGNNIRIWGANGKDEIVKKSIISSSTLIKINKYEKQYGSIGNVLPIPIGLNSPLIGRGGFKGMGDYFDNYLNYVKWLFLDDEQKKKPKNIPNIKINFMEDEASDAYKAATNYFSKFDNYCDYIETNLLQPFFMDSEYQYVKKLDFRKFLCGEELMNKFIDQSIEIIKEREALVFSLIKESKLKNLLANYRCEF